MSQKVIKWTKDGAIIIIIVENYPIPIYLYGFIFAVLWIELSPLLTEKQVLVS